MEMSGSEVSESSGVWAWARTSLASGTARERALGVDQIDRAHGFHSAFEFAQNPDGVFYRGCDR